MKYLQAVLGILFLMLTVYAHNPGADDSLPWIPFTWEPENPNKGIPEKTQFSIPVKITGISQQFEALINLNSMARTMLNGYAFDRCLKKYPALKQRIDTTRIAYIQDIFCPFLTKIELTLGEIVFPETDIPLFYNYLYTAADSLSAKSEKRIATIATDFFADGVLVIDYPNERLCRLNEIAESWKEKFYFVDIRKSKDYPTVILPLKIAGSTRNVIFETDCNMFPLLSTPSKISKIIDAKCCTDTLLLGYGAERIELYGYKIKGAVRLGPIVFDSCPIYEVEYIDDDDLNKAKVWGIIGNRYFLNRTIVIDYKNGKFGISY